MIAIYSPGRTFFLVKKKNKYQRRLGKTLFKVTPSCNYQPQITTQIKQFYQRISSSHWFQKLVNLFCKYSLLLNCARGANQGKSWGPFLKFLQLKIPPEQAMHFFPSKKTVWACMHMHACKQMDKRMCLSRSCPKKNWKMYKLLNKHKNSEALLNSTYWM